MQETFSCINWIKQFIPSDDSRTFTSFAVINQKSFSWSSIANCSSIEFEQFA